MIMKEGRMYGTISKMRIKKGHYDKLSAIAQSNGGPDSPGIMIVYRMDHDPNEIWLVVAAESREAYRANSESRESHERFLRMREHMTEEPEWHDGEVIEFRSTK
jgi:hypothetical protein